MQWQKILNWQRTARIAAKNASGKGCVIFGKMEKGCVILAEIRGQRSFRDPDPEIFREKPGFPDPTGSRFFGILDTLCEFVQDCARLCEFVRDCTRLC